MPRTSLVAERDRQRIEFAGTGRADVDSVTVGLRASCRRRSGARTA